MTIPRLQGFDETVGQSLAQLTDIVGSILNPNAKFNHAMKAAFIEKPELMQKFVDVEKANPGTLAAFGFNDAATNLLAGMQESIPALKARAIAPDIVEQLSTPEGRADVTQQALTGETAGQKRITDFNAWISGEGQELLKKDPVLFVRAVRARLGTGTELEQRQEEIALGRIDLAKELESKPPMEIVNDIALGKHTLSDVTSLITDPGRKQAIELAMRLRDQNLDREASKWIAINRPRSAGTGGGTVMERFKLTQALKQRSAMRGVGSLGAHYKQIWGEDLPGQPGSSEEITLIEKTLKQQQLQQRNTELNVFRRDVGGLIKSINESKNENRQPHIDQLNKLFSDNGIPYTAEWEDRLITRDRIAFKNNATGAVTQDLNAVINRTSPLNFLPPAPIRPAVRQKAAALMSLDDEEAVGDELNRLLEVDPTPDKRTYKELLRALGEQGFDTSLYEPAE